MIEVKKAYIEEFDRIFPLLQHFDIPCMDRNRWHALLSERWSEHRHFGYLLADGENYVGFLGTFFSDRIIAGQKVSICNLFCWYVLPEYRQQSLLLLFNILKEPGITITSLTPSEEASTVLKQFKFRVLEDEVLIFPLVPLPLRGNHHEIVTQKAQIKKLLDKYEAGLSGKLAGQWCREAVIQDKASPKYCHLLFERVIKKGIPFTEIFYVSNPDILFKNMRQLGWLFFRMNRTLFTVMDKRLAGGATALPVFHKRLRYPRLFRSEHIAPHEIDNLFTELLFLKTL